MTGAVDVAVVGATGAVGEAMIEILEQRNFPVGTLYALASERSVGKTLRFRGKSVTVTNLAEFDFSQTPIALFSAGGSLSAEFAPKAAAAGCVVIDNTSHFRRDADIPLVVPEVNPGAIAGYTARGIIANPNCSTIQMLVALKPIYDAVGITRINVATYQAVSGTGKAAIEELAGQTARLLNGQPVETNVYPRQIAFNALPHIDSFQDNGYTREEMKMVWETQKIFGDPDIQVNPPVYAYRSFLAIQRRCTLRREKLSAMAARELLETAPGVTVMDQWEDGGYPTAVTEAAGADPVYGDASGRIFPTRKASPCGLYPITSKRRRPQQCPDCGNPAGRISVILSRS